MVQVDLVRVYSAHPSLFIKSIQQHKTLTMPSKSTPCPRIIPNVKMSSDFLFQWMWGYQSYTIRLQTLPASANVPAMAADSVIPSSACPSVIPRRTPGATTARRTAEVRSHRPVCESFGWSRIALGGPIPSSEAQKVRANV